MINSDYLVWFSTGWMKQNMCASCRILHNPIVFGNLLWWGNMPSLSTGSASTRVYAHKATDSWIFLRSYLDFSYVRTGSNDSIYDTSIIEVVDILCRKSPYYLVYTGTWIFKPSVYIEWLWDQVTSLCCCLVRQLAFSIGLRHFSWDIDPVNTMDRMLKDGVWLTMTTYTQILGYITRWPWSVDEWQQHGPF